MFHGPFGVEHYAFMNPGYCILHASYSTVEGGVKRAVKQDITNCSFCLCVEFACTIIILVNTSTYYGGLFCSRS